MMKNCLVISLTSLTLLMACANNTTTGNPKSDISSAVDTTGRRGWEVLENCPSLQADSPSIEQELNQAMLNQAMAQPESKKIIKVKLPRPVEPEKEGLQPALAEVMLAVEKSGGKVSYEPIKADMAIWMVPVLFYFGGAVIAQITKWSRGDATVATSVPEPQNRFPQANQFDVRMCFFEQDNKVTMMVLVPRGMDRQVTCINN